MGEVGGGDEPTPAGEAIDRRGWGKWRWAEATSLRVIIHFNPKLIKHIYLNYYFVKIICYYHIKIESMHYY